MSTKLPVDASTHSLEAEQATLGALLLAGRGWTDAALAPEDFFEPRHQLIARAIASLASDEVPHDHVTVLHLLEQVGTLEGVGGLAYLSELQRETPGHVHLPAYVGIVRQCAAFRELPKLIASTPQCELTERLKALMVRLEQHSTQQILSLRDVSELEGRPRPPPRDFVWGNIIPARKVISFLGNGGEGKTTVAVQLGVHAAVNEPLFGLDLHGGRVLGIFCEDERDELDRKLFDVCEASGIPPGALKSKFYPLSREGENNLLCTFERDQIVFTPFYHELEATIAHLSPRLVLLDNLADLYGGDYLSTPHVRQFVKSGLMRWCVKYGCTIVLLAHPSASGMASGEGAGFSTAWHNAVRSRLYLRGLKTDNKEAADGRRILEVKKSNYGPSGLQIPLVWRAGAFMPDLEPLEEGGKIQRAPKTDTRLGVEVMRYFDSVEAGNVVTFRAILETLQKSGALPAGDYDTVRKPLSRTLRELEKAKLLAQTKVPRGYRLARRNGNSGDTARDISGDKLGTSGRRDTGTSGHPLRGGVPVSRAPMSPADFETPEHTPLESEA